MSLCGRVLAYHVQGHRFASKNKERVIKRERKGQGKGKREIHERERERV